MSASSFQELFENLQIIGSNATEYGIDPGDFEYDIFSLEELESFEREKNIILPDSYKDFCQVFGTGCFGEEFITIQCPSNYWINHVNPAKIDSMLTSIQSSPNNDIRGQREILELLGSAFIFGGQDYFSVFWDIRTFNKADHSYDIYWALDEPYEGEIYKVGRHFLSFIQDSCLGNGLSEYLPSEFHTHDDIDPTFKHYPKLFFPEI